MAAHNEREVLHHLIEVCEDGERGFLTAAEHVTNPILRALFKQLSGERSQFAAELVPHLQRLGGRTDLGGSTAGTLHRGWIGLKSLVSGTHHDHAVVTEAERGEQVAIDAYEEALNGMLPPTVSGLVEKQRETMQKDYERIRSIDMGYS